MRPLWSPRNASNAGISRVLTERFCAASENFSQRLANSHNLSHIDPLRNRQRMDLPASISTLQRADRWVGAPLCAILTLLRKIFEFAGRPAPRQVQRILFVKFAEQGSTVLAYPAIRRAIEMVGREHVYFVVFEDNRFILDAMEIIPDGNVITIATKSLFGLATGALQAVLQARKIGVDAVVDMEFLTRFSAILTFTTGAKSRVGFHTFFVDGPYHGDLRTNRLLYYSYLHTST